MAAESQSTPESNVDGWRLLGTRDFGCLWAGQVVSQIGDGLNKVALLWFVYEMTGSALKMTAIGLLQTIPPLLFGPLIGVYLDYLPKKTVMIVVDRTGVGTVTKTAGVVFLRLNKCMKRDYKLHYPIIFNDIMRSYVVLK